LENQDLKEEAVHVSTEGETARTTTPTPATVATSTLAATLLSACGGGDDGNGNASLGSEVRPTLVATDQTSNLTWTQPQSDADAARFLLQAQFSASTNEIASVRSIGYAAWLEQQFAATPGQSGWDWLLARDYQTTNATTRRFHESFIDYPADNMLWQQLLSSPDAVKRRMALSLTEFFVVGMPGLNSRIRWPSFMIASWWDTLCSQAFANYRSLLEAVTLHPAMGLYLNAAGNQKENPATGRVPDENYAREVMQLFSIGLYELNNDGTPKNGVLKETYTNADVSNLARVFTGYQVDERGRVADTTTIPGETIYDFAYAAKPMYFTASRHSDLEATFLGVTVPANTPGGTALTTALDTLFNHPNVGPFFGRQMIQRLVTSNPSPAYVGRVAAAFNNNGQGVRGDLKAVWRAILLDEEARSASGLTNPQFGKLREPMVRFIQWARTFSVTSATNSWKLGNFGANLGQGPLRSPSVFNFFRPGYVPPNTAVANAGLVAPEFQLVSEQQVMDYLGAIYSPIRNGFNIRNAAVPENASSGTYTYNVKANYAAEIALAPNASALVDRLDLLLCGGQLKAATKALIVGALASPAVTASSTESDKLNRIAAAIFLIMASADYLVQK
jgi:uncharacterized protein (DUF1800 family)